MKNIKVTRLEADSDCELCGWTCSSGFILEADGNKIDEVIPVASCTSPVSIDEDDMWVRIFEKLGINLEISYEDG